MQLSEQSMTIVYIEHKMTLNPKKCKEMYVNLLLQCDLGSYKLLGVIISDDLKWNAHVEYVIFWRFWIYTKKSLENNISKLYTKQISHR